MRFTKLPASLVTLAMLFLLVSCAKKPESPWRTAPVEKGDLNVEVTASGIVNPHTLVAVGTQVSGTIARIFVDFNSRVKKDQLIALLDTTFLSAAVLDAGASLQKAVAQEQLTKNNADRSKTLFEKGLISTSDVDQAAADHASALASVSSARAQLDRARINLAYAYIRSPITGVVVNRNVDVGQTVAASFSTPTLFSIADDLSKMQIQASIDEADIGQVKIGQGAKFTVDAYPDSSFTGIVSQIRLQPTSVQNVVTYTVMIDVDNPYLMLMPGMTANLTIAVQQAHDVLKVPVAALKFVPSKPGDKSFQRSKGGNGQPGAPGAQGAWRQRSDSARTQGTAFAHKGEPKIFILENGKPKRVPVTTGITSGGYVAVEGDLAAGQEVIVGTAATAKSKAPAGTPLGIPGGGMPGGRMH
jgi:HlyD family secretion protein